MASLASKISPRVAKLLDTVLNHTGSFKWQTFKTDDELRQALKFWADFWWSSWKESHAKWRGFPFSSGARSMRKWLALWMPQFKAFAELWSRGPLLLDPKLKLKPTFELMPFLRSRELTETPLPTHYVTPKWVQNVLELLRIATLEQQKGGALGTAKAIGKVADFAAPIVPAIVRAAELGRVRRRARQADLISRRLRGEFGRPLQPRRRAKLLAKLSGIKAAQRAVRSRGGRVRGYGTQYSIHDIRKHHKRKNLKRRINWKQLVWDGQVAKTPGGLTRKDLMISKSGKIVSKKQHARGVALMRRLKSEGRWAPKFK